MTKEEIKNYLDDFRTDPIEVNATCKYNIPAFKEITYRVIFYCTELDIKWDSKGVILDVGFDCSVFELFRECKLDVDELVEEMDGIISRVPSARSDLKDFLRHFDDVDHSFEIDFVNLEWREAYEFCAADDVMHVSVNFKPEVNFILQWTSAKYVISLEIAGDSREYSLCKVPGKKGTYYFGSVGQEVRSILEKLSMFYSQFGFSFDEFINDITETCENGKSYGVRILKDTDSPWASNSAIHQLAHDEDDEEEDDDEEYDEEDDDDEEYDDEDGDEDGDEDESLFCSTLTNVVDKIAGGLESGDILSALSDLKCPRCGSVIVIYNKKNNLYVCMKCHHYWRG